MPEIASRPITTKGASLATQPFGARDNPAILLVMGATFSMCGWPDALCHDLADRGHFVLRFDHRDTGQSTSLPPGEGRYSVEDMATDVIAVMDAYDLPRAHLVGMSLGGYIAQMVALDHAPRIETLSLIASEPLGWDGPALPHISAAFLAHFEKLETVDLDDRKALAAYMLESERLSAGTGVPFDEAAARARVAAMLDHAQNPSSMFNHGALTTIRDWAGRFRAITQPVLVLHGEDDPILPLDNGRAIANGIPGARLAVLPGTGHELPERHLTRIADQIADHVATARPEN